MAINRTKVELKRIKEDKTNDISYYQSYQSGIETAANDKQHLP